MSDLIDTPKHADLIYDVGLHRGEDTDFYLRKGFRVVAFDANPELVNGCRERFKDAISEGRLTIVEGAIIEPGAAGPGQNRVRFFKSDSSSAWGTVRADWAQRSDGGGTATSVIEVEAVDFVEIMKRHGVPRYLKIDIEGCDLVCLKSLKRFRERPDYLSFESDRTSYANICEEIKLLTDLGYDRFQAVEQAGIPGSQIPPNPALEGRHAAQKFVPSASGLFGAELSGKWKSTAEILRAYRVIRFGYYLLGDNGVMYRWQFRGASRLRRAVKACLQGITKAQVPGWYDTHARLATAVRRMN